MIQLSQVGTVAAKEFRDRLRNRWVLAVALVFAVFSLVIAYAGGAQQGAARRSARCGAGACNGRGSGAVVRTCECVSVHIVQSRY